MAKTLPKTQEEARGILAQQISDTVAAYNNAKNAGDETQMRQLLQQYRDLNKQWEAAKAGTFGSLALGAKGGLQSGGEFLMRGAQQIAPILTTPARLLSDIAQKKYGKTVTEPQSQEQLVPFRVGEAFGQLPYSPGSKAQTLLGLGISGADIAAETMGARQGAVSGSVLLAMMAKGGWTGLKNWREGRKFEDLMKQLPTDMPDLERNALKRFMLTGQGSDNGIVAAAMQRLETSPQFAEMFAKLRQGATEQTLSGMHPTTGKLTKEEAKTGFIQGIQNQLASLKETAASSIFSPKTQSLYEKAKGYGGDRGIVAPENTLSNIDGLIAEYSAKDTDSSKRAVAVLSDMRNKLLEQRPVNPEQAAAFGAVGGLPETTNKLTVAKVQGMLSEWGKKASQGDSLIKDLAVSDEQRISSAIFGGLKDDIRNSYKLTSDAQDKKALDLLTTAREQTSAAATRYTDALAQRMPSFLKDKNPSSLDFNTLVGEYEKLNPQQRATVRQWVGDTDPEVLKQFDRQVYTNFLDKARDTNGQVDLGKLTTLWNSTKVADRDAVTTALGVNAGEFNARMRDATAFNNRIRVAQAQAEKSALAKAAPDVARAAGTTLGYSAHQAVMLGADVAEQLLNKSKLSDDQLMKLLLTPEGADFLKTSKMTPGAVQTLENLTKVVSPTVAPPLVRQQVATELQQPAQQPIQAPGLPAFQMPEEETQQQQGLPAFQMPD